MFPPVGFEKLGNIRSGIHFTVAQGSGTIIKMLFYRSHNYDLLFYRNDIVYRFEFIATCYWKYKGVLWP